MIGTYYPCHDRPLFSGHHLITYLDERLRAARKAVDAIPAPALLGSFVDELAGELTTRFALDIVVLLRDCVTESVEPLAMPRDAVLVGRAWFPVEPPAAHAARAHVVGELLRFHVPYLGNADLLALRGAQRALASPRAEVRPGALVYSYPVVAPGDVAIARARFDHALDETAAVVDAHVDQVEAFDARLETTVRQLVQSRRARLAAAFSADLHA